MKEQMTEGDPRWGLNRPLNTVKSSLVEKMQEQSNGLQRPRFTVDCPAGIDDDEEETEPK